MYRKELLSLLIILLFLPYFKTKPCLGVCECGDLSDAECRPRGSNQFIDCKNNSLQAITVISDASASSDVRDEGVLLRRCRALRSILVDGMRFDKLTSTTLSSETLPALYRLDLKYMYSTLVGNAILKNFPNITSLSIETSDIKSIDIDVFEQCGILTSLTIKSTMINIDKVLLRRCVLLKRVSLIECRLLHIPDDVKYLGALVSLDLSGNAITEIPSSIFKTLSKLQKVILRGNRIGILHDDTFGDGMSSLRYIDLAKNQIKQMSDTTFTSPGLLRIILDNNLITSVRWNAFVRCKRLAVFSCRNCDIQTCTLPREVRNDTSERLLKKFMRFKACRDVRDSMQSTLLHKNLSTPQVNDNTSTTPTPAVNTDVNYRQDSTITLTTNSNTTHANDYATGTTGTTTTGTVSPVDTSTRKRLPKYPQSQRTKSGNVMTPTMDKPKPTTPTPNKNSDRTSADDNFKRELTKRLLHLHDHLASSPPSAGTSPMPPVWMLIVFGVAVAMLVTCVVAVLLYKRSVDRRLHIYHIELQQMRGDSARLLRDTPVNTQT